MLISQTTRFAELQSRIHGRVLTEADEAWNASRQTFNLTHDQRPAALIRVANADDVAETVRYAAQRGLRVAPQGTGHNAGPIDGLEDALLLRTDSLQDIEIDVAARRARVGAGVRWGSVADRLAGTGLAALHGSSRTVGVTGYSLGGGIGWQSRKHGLQSNALTAIEIVTADGELRRIDHDNETDLFWAVRGGGGNYGVVTALEFELFPTPDVYAGALIFPYERGYEVMHAWHEYVSAGMPDELTTWAKLMHFPPIEEIPEPFRGGSFTILQIAYLGNEADGAELIAPLTSSAPTSTRWRPWTRARSATSPWTPRTRCPTRSPAGRCPTCRAPASTPSSRRPGPWARTSPWSSSAAWAAPFTAARPGTAPARRSTATTCSWPSAG